MSDRALRDISNSLEKVGALVVLDESVLLREDLVKLSPGHRAAT